MTTNNAAVKNETLSVFAQGFFAMRETSLIDFVAPFVATGIAQGDYNLFDQADPFNIYNTVVADEGESPTVHFNCSKGKFDCDFNGLKIPITYKERARAGDGFEIYRQGKLQTLLSTQLVNRERAGWAKIAAAITAASSKGTWKGTTGASADPIDEIDDLIETINNKTGSMPNAIAIGLPAWRVLKNHPKVLSRLSGLKSHATEEDIRGMLLNPNIEIRIGSMPYNSAKLGKTKSASSIIGSDLYIFHRSANPTTDDMSAFKTFSVDGTGLGNVMTHDVALRHTMYDEVMWSEDLVVTAPIAVARISVA